MNNDRGSKLATHSGSCVYRGITFGILHSLIAASRSTQPWTVKWLTAFRLSSNKNKQGNHR